MKICILGNQARAMSNFWTVLIRGLTGAGHETVCLLPCGPDGPNAVPGPDEAVWEEKLLALGVRIVRYPLDRKGLNPLRDVKTLLALQTILKKEKPDRLFGFTIKPVIYGAMASAFAGQPDKAHRFFMVTGLGYMFEGDTAIKRILTQVARLLYRLAFSCSGAVFFQNEDDRALFDRLSIIPQETQVYMSKGCGVDTDFFAPAPPRTGAPLFLFVGRLLEAKGLRDIAAAARIVKARHPEARFCILGPAEHGPGSVPLEEVQGWHKEGIIEYLGETRDVRPYLEDATAVLLPSWREGTPCSLMEAMSMGRAVIAADAPGSREVVRDGVNGFLTPVRDEQALANAVESFILDPELAVRMGTAGRELARSKFCAHKVAEMLMDCMDIPART